jgi:phosphoribosylaminoimidazole-succinocarboxamide synthase
MSTFDKNGGLLETNITGFPKRKGKVRDIYELDSDHLIIVSTDRISAFDYVLPNAIPGRGKLLTELSIFWMDRLPAENHLISEDLKDMPIDFQGKEFEGRTMLVQKCEVVPIECIVRGYIAGSGWQDYERTDAIAGVPLPKGLKPNQQFAYPIFTPSTKEEKGHDINITFREMCYRVGKNDSEQLRDLSISLYQEAATLAWYAGIIIADTKFEFGRLPDGEFILIDEVLTADSSRFWPLSEYQLGISMPSFDKQFIRDYLTYQSGWDKNSPPPQLPDEIIKGTQERYAEVMKRLRKISDEDENLF